MLSGCVVTIIRSLGINLEGGIMETDRILIDAIQ